MASSLMPSMKCVQMRSLAEPEEEGRRDREGRRHVSELLAERAEPLSARTPCPLTVCHERRDDPQLVVRDEGGSVGQDVGVAEEFRDMEFPLQALVSCSQNQGQQRPWWSCGSDSTLCNARGPGSIPGQETQSHMLQLTVRMLHLKEAACCNLVQPNKY